MDRSSGKKGVTPRKVYSVTPFKGAATETGQNSQSCNRIGCSGRIKCSPNARNGNSDKSNCSKPSFCSSNGNETTGKSSRSSSIDSKGKMSYQIKSNPYQSNVSSESEAPELVSSSSNLSGNQLESKEVRMTKPRSCSESSNVGPLKTFRNKSNQNTPPASSVPSVSRSSVPGPYNRSKGSRTSLRNLKCSPASESVVKNTMKKRSLEGESSSSNRGRKIITPSPASSGISISSNRSSSSSGEDISSTAPIWARRSMNVNNRMRFSGRQNGRNSSSAINYPHIHDNERPFSGSYRLSSSNGNNPSSRTPAEPGLTRLINHDVYDMDGIVEVLLALERIEQDHELTHEQFLALETGLFLSGLNLYDQHRQMRLDIDNMSYEELLALEDRMGTVSTALSEEAVSKCLRSSIYHAIPSNVQTSEDGDDIKCSVCQEEYANGDEIGKLVHCEHGYHATCINQWLKVKNWCPICKAPAEPSQS